MKRKGNLLVVLRALIVVSLALITTGNTLAAQSEQKLKVFELSHRQAADLVVQLQALYPDEDVLFSADGQRLVVKGPAAVIAEVEALAARLDVAPAQLRVTVRRQAAGQNGHPSSRRITTRDGQSRQSVVVQSGETARIEAGTIRRVTRAVSGGDYIGLIAEDTPMTAGFLVQPRALGSNQIELRVISFDDEPPMHSTQASPRDTAAVVTQRRVSPGEWVSLGSSDTTHDSISQGQTYSTRETGQHKLNWSIRVDLVP